MIKYHGQWKDLGTWNTLTDELIHHTYGNVITDGSGTNTHIFNELNFPLLCIGTKDLIIAASPNGIIMSEKQERKCKGLRYRTQTSSHVRGAPMGYLPRD